MKRLLVIAKRTLITAIIALAILYIGDFLHLRYRMWKPRPNDPFEVVTLDRYYAISQKNGRIEFAKAPLENVTCVHSLFPHAGYNPCWYVIRQNGTAIPLVIFPRMAR